MTDVAALNESYLAMNVAAAFIAGFGLMENSPAVIHQQDNQCDQQIKKIRRSPVDDLAGEDDCLGSGTNTASVHSPAGWSLE